MTATADPINTDGTPIFSDLVEEKVGEPSLPDFKTSAYEDPDFFELDTKIQYPQVADIEHDIDAGLIELLEPGAFVAEMEPVVDAQVANRLARAVEQPRYEDPETETFAPVEAPIEESGSSTVTVNMADLLAEDDEESEE